MSLETMVQQFNETYKADVMKTKPELPADDKAMASFGNLIVEELGELALAFEQRDPVAFLDACTDIIYVTAQQASLYGFPIDSALREVHSSNMSKLGEDGKPIIREEDGKVLKGPNFQEPDLKKLLEV